MNVLTHDPGGESAYALFGPEIQPEQHPMLPKPRRLLDWSLTEIVPTCPFVFVTELQWLAAPQVERITDNRGKVINGNRGASAKSILRLALRAGIATGKAIANPHCCAAYALQPTIWKDAFSRSGGRISKERMCERIRRCLTVEQLAVLGKIRSAKKQTDMLDAYGIGQGWFRVANQEQYRLTEKDGVFL